VNVVVKWKVILLLGIEPLTHFNTFEPELNAQGVVAVTRI
jgi:hypothetical protein